MEDDTFIAAVAEPHDVRSLLDNFGTVNALAFCDVTVKHLHRVSTCMHANAKLTRYVYPYSTFKSSASSRFLRTFFRFWPLSKPKTSSTSARTLVLSSPRICGPRFAIYGS